MTLATAPGTPRRVSKPNLRTFTYPPHGFGPNPPRISPARPFPPRLSAWELGFMFFGESNRLELPRPGKPDPDDSSQTPPGIFRAPNRVYTWGL